jgi:hypothetical protein
LSSSLGDVCLLVLQARCPVLVIVDQSGDRVVCVSRRPVLVIVDQSGDRVVCVSRRPVLVLVDQSGGQSSSVSCLDLSGDQSIASRSVSLWTSRPLVNKYS